MGNALKEALKGKNSESRIQNPEARSQEPVDGRVAAARIVNDVAAADPVKAMELLMGIVEGVEIEAVIGGALMRLRLAAGTDPTTVAPLLKAIDPGVKLRDDFPRGGAYGKRETQLTRCVMIELDASRDSLFISLICNNGESRKVAVSKKSSGEFMGKLEALGKVGDKGLTQLQHAMETKKSVLVALGEEEQFGALYYEFEGKAYLDGLQAEPPAEVEAKE